MIGRVGALGVDDGAGRFAVGPYWAAGAVVGGNGLLCLADDGPHGDGGCESGESRRRQVEKGDGAVRGALDRLGEASRCPSPAGRNLADAG
jgi:hypothetical protein